jgi:Na+/proline symporter
MTVAKLIFLGIMAICALISFMAPVFAPEQKYKDNNAKRLRIIVKTRMICFLTFLVMLLLCVIL